MKKYSIGGVFVKRSLTGVTRYSWELMDELDRQIKGKNVEIELVVPEGVEIDREYENIRVVHYGREIKFFWYNITFPIYLLKNKSVGIHLGVNVPWLKPDVVCIYDVNSIANPQFFSKYHMFKTKLEKRIAVKHAKKIFTISQFSVDEIEKYVGKRQDTIDIVPCGWQHLDRLKATGSVEEKYGVKPGAYYFSMSSVAPTKNFKWVIEAAKQNPEDYFVIAGGIDPKSFGLTSIDGETPNFKYVGRVSDEDAKLLMKNCKAFLFPSYYEGFGIPPMEAFACGASRVVVSDIPVMHEVCGDSAYYIDPFEYKNINMNRILEQKVGNAENVLKKYSWENSARIFLKMLESL